MEVILKNIFILFTLLIISNKTQAQCPVDILQTNMTIDCGESVDLSALGLSGSSVLFTNFNTLNIGPGWSTSATLQYNNPCSPSLDGTPSAWFGNVPLPRTLTTNGFDLSCGGQICFDFDFANPQNNGSSCEDPDLPDEGVFLQYSIDNGITWVDLFYFMPSSSLPSNAFYTWQNYCFDLPPAGWSTNTMFQWTQNNITSTIHDHWGIDNVNIFALNCSYWYDWSNIPGFPDTTNQTVTPAVTTTYVVTYTNGVDSCVDSVTVNVNPLIIDATVANDTICQGSCTDLNLSIFNPQTDTCSQTANASGPNNAPTTLTLNPSSCVPLGETITGITLDANAVTCFWQNYDIIIDGIPQFTGVCSVQSGLDLSPFLPITSIVLSSNPASVIGATINMNVTLNITYGLNSLYTSVWSPALSLNNANIQNPNACPTTSTTYLATLTSASGCIATDSVTVEVNASTTGTVIVDTTVCNGGSVTVNGTVYNALNPTGTEVLMASNGCDSTIIIILTELPILTNTIDTTVCNGDSVTINGITYNASNPTGTETLITANGCDSTITVTLTELSIITTQISDTICSGTNYTFPDGTINNLTSDTTHISTLMAESGCDSIVTLNLTITNLITGIDTQVTCGSYTWIDGINYTTSNTTATFILIGGSFGGCDSIVTLNLTITNLIPGTDTQVACGSYTWIDGINYTSSNTTATFILIGGSFEGCDSIVTLDLTISNLGTTIDAGLDVEICTGETAILTATPNTIGNTYNWSEPGFASIGTNDNLTVTPSDTTIYTLQITDALGCIAFDSVMVNVNPTSVVTVPLDSSYCAGVIVPATTFTSIPVGATTYDWFHSNPAVGLGAGMSGNVPAFTATNITLFPDTTIVSVYPTLNSCIGDTVDYLIIVNPIPTAPTVDSALVCINNAATLTATAPGGIYQWFDAATGGTLLFTGASYTTPVLNTDTSYWVQSNIDGCTSPRTQVYITIGAGLVVDAGLNVDICAGQTANLAAIPTTLNNTFSWTEPGGGVISNISNPSVMPTDTTIYTLEVTDMFGCNGIDSVTVNVKPTPTVIVPLDTTYCNGDVVAPNIFNSIPTGADYTWTNSNPGIGLTFTAGINNTLGFTATNSTTQTISSTITVTPTYLTCVGTPVSYIISVNPIPTLITPSNIAFCIGDMVDSSQIVGTPTGVNFSWTNSNPAIGLGTTGVQNVPSFTATNTTLNPITGNIIVTPTANGCTGPSINYNVRVTAPIIIDRVIKDAICFGSSNGEIRVIPSGGTPNYNYSWTNGDTDSIASNLSAGPITVTITDVNNCTQDSIFIITETDSIDYISFSAFPRNGCSPLEVKFTSTINPSIHLVKNYVWDFGNNLIPQDTFIAHSIYQDPGTYDVSLTVTDFSGCSNTLTLNDFIEVFEDPEAHFTTSPESPDMLNPTIYFTDTSFPNVVDWEWYFDSLGTSFNQHPDFTFPGDSGTYWITLIVQDDKTCRDTLTKIVRVKSEIALYFPNSFTPNGDGINEVFIPKGFGVDLTDYSFLIFNRWGELVFESHDLFNGWDGSFNGELMQSGIYVWKAHFKDLNGTNYRQDGQVNIFR